MESQISSEIRNQKYQYCTFKHSNYFDFSCNSEESILFLHFIDYKTKQKLGTDNFKKAVAYLFSFG